MTKTAPARGRDAESETVPPSTQPPTEGDYELVTPPNSPSTQPPPPTDEDSDYEPLYYPKVL